MNFEIVAQQFVYVDSSQAFNRMLDQLVMNGFQPHGYPTVAGGYFYIMMVKYKKPGNEDNS
jgi:hypothetical protein